MTADAAADRGQRAAEALMVDICRIYTEGDPVLNPTTGQNVRPQTTLYTGKCRIRPNQNGTSSDVDAGQTRVDVAPFVVSVPLSVVTVTPGALVEPLSSRDPSLLAKRLSVVSVIRGTHITARRLSCEEAT